MRCEEGWYEILDRLDKALAEINPDYVVHQCKEKFGALQEDKTARVEAMNAEDLGRLGRRILTAATLAELGL